MTAYKNKLAIILRKDIYYSRYRSFEDYGVREKAVFVLSASDTVASGNRIFNPIGTFTDGFEVIIKNNTSYNITFDSSGIAKTVYAGGTSIFFYDAEAESWI